jgi:drug/metabolite transporter (DMT)-like permease
MMKKRTLGRVGADLLMLLAAILWGGGFVAQRIASTRLGFFAFNGVRFLLAGLLLLPLALKFLKVIKKRQLIWILPAGLFLFAGAAFQQAGLESTTAGAASFITGIYVVLVPLFLALFWKEKITWINWVAALTALLGTFLLSTGGRGFSLSRGDTLVLIGSMLWSFQIIFVGMAVRKLDIYIFSAGQFLVCGLINMVCSMFVDFPTLPDLQAVWLAVIYGGVFSVAGGFTLQAIGQKEAPTADASLILCLEAVFGAAFGALLLGEKMDTVQIIGAAIIMVSIFAAQIVSIRLGRRVNAPDELLTKQ